MAHTLTSPVWNPIGAASASAVRQPEEPTNDVLAPNIFKNLTAPSLVTAKPPPEGLASSRIGVLAGRYDSACDKNSVIGEEEND